MKNRYSLSFFSMGTLMSLVSYDDGAQPVLEKSALAVRELDRTLSRKNPESDLSRLNDGGWSNGLCGGPDSGARGRGCGWSNCESGAPGDDGGDSGDSGGWVRVDGDLRFALEEAVRFSEKTGGAYDPTLGLLSDLWSEAARKGVLPEPPEAEGLLPGRPASTERARVDLSRPDMVRLGEGVSIDLGGIGKGYAADRIMELCKGRISTGLFSLGTSSIAALGGRPDGEDWTVGLRLPEKNAFSCFGVLRLRDLHISTSGDYESEFTIDGNSYHHIIDPLTGYPADTDLRSVTIISESGAMSEAYSTACLVMGLEKARAFHQKEQTFEAVFLTKTQKAICTPGAQKLFTSNRR
jgi:thiamine biosynthesis lipoprotein